MMKEYVKLVRAVLKKLLGNQLYAKLSKCNLNKTSLDYLGYRVSAGEIEMDPGICQFLLTVHTHFCTDHFASNQFIKSGKRKPSQTIELDHQMSGGV